jgi:hypothetical protein
MYDRLANPNPGRTHIDDFQHECPNGSHGFVIFEVLCEDLRGLSMRYRDYGVFDLVKRIAQQVLDVVGSSTPVSVIIPSVLLMSSY